MIGPGKFNGTWLTRGKVKFTDLSYFEAAQPGLAHLHEQSNEDFYSRPVEMSGKFYPRPARTNQMFLLKSTWAWLRHLGKPLGVG